jgi:hypothetical protein
MLVLISLIAVLAPSAIFAQASDPMAGVMTWLHDNMGMEMGSVSIGGTSYSKIVLSPEVRIGRLKMGFYLPVIYKDDLFNPSTWYAPGGNNEWNFGANYWASGDYLHAALDTAADLILKIKYIEFGQPLDDKFFVKVGSLHDLTIGHGLIMRNYRNDSDFPSIRKTGLNLGYDFGSFGFEALADDLPVPEVVGARLYARPFKGSKLAVGLSGVADLAAASDMTDPSFSAVTNNFVFLGTGADLDLPIIQKNEILSLRAFADAAVTVPYVKEAFTYNSTPISQGLQTSLIWDNGPRNWGAAAGFLGNVLFIDWRLEYRYFTGVFRPSFFDSTYDRSRSLYVQQYLDYLANPGSIATAPITMGVYGEAAFSLFKDKLSFSAGYMWPWDPSVGFVLPSGTSPADELHAGFIIKKGLIPVLDLAGAVYYDKRGLVNSIVDGNFRFLDEKTAFAGEVDFPIPGTTNLSVAAIFKAVAVMDSSGNIVYNDPTDPSKGVKMLPSITIETRFRL